MFKEGVSLQGTNGEAHVLTGLGVRETIFIASGLVEAVTTGDVAGTTSVSVAASSVEVIRPTAVLLVGANLGLLEEDTTWSDGGSMVDIVNGGGTDTVGEARGEVWRCGGGGDESRADCSGSKDTEGNDGATHGGERLTSRELKR